MSEVQIANVNIGILGHVDSGKTSLCKALSTQASTAAFDKNPQSQERGITLDLGFSAFYIDVDDEMKQRMGTNVDKIQYTLVDCPGHAKLIRTIIGGAQIIDFMVLVIDVIKGVQTQTAECIVIGEITAKNLIVVLNKIDLIPEQGRENRLTSIKQKLVKNVFSSTKFKNPPIIGVSATEGLGLSELIAEFNRTATVAEKKQSTDPFLFAIDHCFPIKGKGTVMTGTVLHGSVQVNQNIEIAGLNEQKKVKSIQMFKKPVSAAHEGDRVGILVTQLDSNKLERGFASDIGVVRTVDSVIAKVSRIKFYKKEVKTKSKMHISVGHSTVMGNVAFFQSPNELFDSSESFSYCEELPEEATKNHYFAKIDFETPISCYHNAKLIASKLDSDINLNNCRLAFSGVVLSMLGASEKIDLKVYRQKERTATVDRIVDDHNLIGNNLLQKKNARLDLYINKKVLLTTSDGTLVSRGIIESPFGRSGKFKVRLNDPIPVTLTKKPKEMTIKIKYQVNIYDKERSWTQQNE